MVKPTKNQYVSAIFTTIKASAAIDITNIINVAIKRPEERPTMKESVSDKNTDNDFLIIAKINKKKAKDPNIPVSTKFLTY